MVSEPKLSYYISKAKSLSNGTFENQIRVALLGSFTLNGLGESIRVKCMDKKIKCITFVSGYDQYNQNILNADSKLYEFSPDISFLILDTRTILKDLFYFPYSISAADRREYVAKRANEILSLVNIFTERLGSKLVLTNFSIPAYSPYGIYETKTEYGLQDMIRDLNSKLSNALIYKPSVYIYDFNAFITKYGEVNVFDYRQFIFGDIKIALNYIPYFAEELMGYIKPLAGINRKCIVVDLDNTLWGGVVGEDGFERIELGPKAPGIAYVEFQRHLLSLCQRGIILAINSKNNPDDALKVIREHPYMVLREENFASIRINWDDKISNMKQIAQELNIGLDSIAYFDDDPVNREVMNKALPEVLTVDLPEDSSLYAPTLLSMTDFNVLTITDEDTKRGQMYIQQRKRKELETTMAAAPTTTTTTNLDEFLSQLGIKIKIKKADQFTIPRIAQLILKTNQFNLTTHRYQEEEIRKFAQDSSMIVGCAQIEDKFGDNGITGAFIIRKDSASEWNIDTFLLSCRVMGRGVERAIMGFILNEAKKERVTAIKAQYIPTKKNKPCEDFLSTCGFQPQGEHWIYSPTIPVKIPKYLEVKIE
jgi:FkbH-like protein